MKLQEMKLSKFLTTFWAKKNQPKTWETAYYPQAKEGRSAWMHLCFQPRRRRILLGIRVKGWIRITRQCKKDRYICHRSKRQTTFSHLEPPNMEVTFSAQVLHSKAHSSLEQQPIQETQHNSQRALACKVSKVSKEYTRTAIWRRHSDTRLPTSHNVSSGDRVFNQESDLCLLLPMMTTTSQSCSRWGQAMRFQGTSWRRILLEVFKHMFRGCRRENRSMRSWTSWSITIGCQRQGSIVPFRTATTDATSSVV